MKAYLGHYAEPQALQLAKNWQDQTYQRVVVVPAMAELDNIIDCLTAIGDATRHPTLAIVVVNHHEAVANEVIENNNETLFELNRHLSSVRSLRGNPGFWGRFHDQLDVAVLNHCDIDTLLHSKDGVGHARKIGCDLALALIDRNIINNHWIYTTDADARVPSSYFDQSRFSDAAAYIFPFQHKPTEDPAEAQAIKVYDDFLRYYLAGLEQAKSPYAFFTIGSTIIANATAYASVRGFPKRAAGEDFYLLNKLAKVGPIREVPTEQSIILDGRRSWRVPFGTGAAVNKIADLEDINTYSVYHPKCFQVLGDWLSQLENFSENPDIKKFVDETSSMSPRLDNWQEKFHKVLTTSLREDRTVERRRKRIHDWFDGFRTLKFIHDVRDTGREII